MEVQAYTFVRFYIFSYFHPTIFSSLLHYLLNILHPQDFYNKLKGLSEQEKLRQRKEKVALLVDKFFTWVKRYRENVSRESETGKGCTYALNQETYLREFLKDARIPLDNNAAERTIR